jgi:hypothetical protein
MRLKVLMLASLLLAAAPAAAQNRPMVDARNPAQIVEIARGFGSAELEKNADGDPRITGRINGTRYIINFMGCRENRNCTHIIFRAGWNDAKATFDEVNKYNSTKAFGVVYLDRDGDVNVDMPVNLAHGGVARRNMDDTFDWWRLVLRDVIEAFVNKRRT